MFRDSRVRVRVGVFDCVSNRYTNDDASAHKRNENENQTQAPENKKIPLRREVINKDEKIK